MSGEDSERKGRRRGGKLGSCHANREGPKKNKKNKQKNTTRRGVDAYEGGLGALSLRTERLR